MKVFFVIQPFLFLFPWKIGVSLLEIPVEGTVYFISFRLIDIFYKSLTVNLSVYGTTIRLKEFSVLEGVHFIEILLYFFYTFLYIFTYLHISSYLQIKAVMMI